MYVHVLFAYNICIYIYIFTFPNMYIHFPNMYIPHSIYNTHSCVVCAYNTYIYIYTSNYTQICLPVPHM